MSALTRQVSILKGLILEKLYKLFVGTIEIVHSIPVSTVLENANEALITRLKVIKNWTITQLLYLTGKFNDDFITGYIFCNFASNCLIILNNRQRKVTIRQFQKIYFLNCNSRHLANDF